MRKRTIGVHELGVEFVEDQLGIENLYEAANSPLVSYLNNALKAKELFQRDKDYIVRDGEVLIVDEFTGRVLLGRRYNEGMHQAIEAKENVEIKAENQTLATITLQNYFRLYDKLSGMTGTAQTEAAELHEIYKLGVVPHPDQQADDPRRPVRPDLQDRGGQVRRGRRRRRRALREGPAGADRHHQRRALGVPVAPVHQARHPAQRAQRQVPRAGSRTSSPRPAAAVRSPSPPTWPAAAPTSCSAATSTSSPTSGCASRAWTRSRRPRSTRPPGTRCCRRSRREAAEEAEEVIDVGGLYVLGTERHESRRIDNQLRGRSGRQGDPGESRFYLSLGDELMRRFNGATLESLLTRLNLPDDVPIEAKMVTRAIKSAQTQVEQQNFEIRKNVLKYDEVMNQQRKVIYDERRRILEGENLAEQAHHMLVDVVTAYVDGATAEGYSEDWDLETLWTALKTLYPVGIDHHDLIDSDAVGEPGDLTRDELRDALIEDAERAYAEREKQLEEIAGEGAMRQLERNVLLNVIDRKWREHLYEMDYLKEGIGLRAMAQRDPLIEYQREGYDMFVGMLDGLKEESVGFLFNVHGRSRACAGRWRRLPRPAGLAEFAAAAAGPGSARRRRRHQGARAGTSGACAPRELTTRHRRCTYSGPSEDGSAQVQRAWRRPEGTRSAGSQHGGSGAKPRAGRPAGKSRRSGKEELRLALQPASTTRAPQPICRATIRQRSFVSSMRAGDGPDSLARRYVPNTSAASPSAVHAPRCHS